LSLPNQGNLESEIVHGTGYTEHNKIKTPPKEELFSVAGQRVLRLLTEEGIEGSLPSGKGIFNRRRCATRRVFGRFGPK